MAQTNSGTRMARSMLLCCFALAAGALAGCSGSGDTELVTFQFKMAGDSSGTEDFRATTADPQLIETLRAQLALPADQRRLHAAGPVAYGDGDINLDWGWHFLPDDWKAVEVSIESCDTTPSQIAQAVDYWVAAPHGACPWASYVADEVGS